MAEVNTNAPLEGTNAATNQTEPAESVTATEPVSTPDATDLLKQIADLKAELNRNKKARDKALSEVGEYKKQLRAKMTADEQAEIERQEAEAERKAYVASLEAYKKKSEATARYALQGMNQEMATQAADAEISGDMDLLADIQRKHAQQMVKDAQAEWLKSRPELNAGGGSGAKVTQEQFDKMGMIERTKLYNESPEVYKALLANSK